MLRCMIILSSQTRDKSIIKKLLWSLMAWLGTPAFGTDRLVKRRAAQLLVPGADGACPFEGGYRFCSRFIARRILGRDNNRATPVEAEDDGGVSAHPR